MKQMIYAVGAVLLLLTIVSPTLAAEPRIADIPAEHWAYQAVKKLVSQGYLGLFPDNTFRGQEPVDRYTLAVLVARMLEDTVAGKTAMSKEDAELLRSLSGEFRQELVNLATHTQALAEALAQYERDRTAMSADMAAWHDETTQVRQENIALKERMSGLEKTVEENVQTIADLQEKVTRLENKNPEMKRKESALIWVAAILAVIAAL